MILVYIKQIDLGIIEPWINRQISTILGFEDEIISKLTMNLIDTKNQFFPDPREIQIELTGFLERHT